MRHWTGSSGIKMRRSSFKKRHLNMSSANCKLNIYKIYDLSLPSFKVLSGVSIQICRLTCKAILIINIRGSHDRHDHFIFIMKMPKPRNAIFILNDNLHSTQKKLGSTQNCLVRQENALPIIHQLPLPLSNTWPPYGNYFFQFYLNISFLRTHTEMITKLYWYWNI